MAAVETAGGPRTYGNWRKPKSAGILGLGQLGTAVLITGLVFVVLVVAVAGFLKGLMAFVALSLFLGTILIRDKHDRNLLDRFIVAQRAADEPPVWPYGLVLYVLAGIGATLVAIRRVRTPVKRLPSGTRIA